MNMRSRLQQLKRYFVAGLFVVVPAWGTFLILSTLFVTLDGLWEDLLGPVMTFEMPGAGIALLFLLILGSGMLGTRLVGQRFVKRMEDLFERIPLVRSIYYTLKGMTDVFQFRERFGQSTVVVFPFPRTGLWAIGFLMGRAPAMLQIAKDDSLVMVFVPTAIHPFTGYLAFVGASKIHLVNLRPEEAMKLEFSAGLYRPPKGWLAVEPHYRTLSPRGRGQGEGGRG